MALSSEQQRSRAARDLLSRSEVVPLYYQLEELLESRILAGVPHERLPSERELCEEFDVSRAVVRPALEILERQGRIVRVQGKGTFVAPPKQPLPIRGLLSLFARAIPHDTEIRVIDASARATKPGAFSAVGIDIADAARALRVSALVSCDGRPRCLVNSTIAIDRVPQLATVLRPSARLSGVGPFTDVRLGPARVRMESGTCPDYEAEQLALAPGSHVFVAHLSQYEPVADDTTPTAIESAWLIYPADLIALDLALSDDVELPAPDVPAARDRGARPGASGVSGVDR